VHRGRGNAGANETSVGLVHACSCQCTCQGAACQGIAHGPKTEQRNPFRQGLVQEGSPTETIAPQNHKQKNQEHSRLTTLPARLLFPAMAAPIATADAAAAAD
jgi:hypothetical protein